MRMAKRFLKAGLASVLFLALACTSKGYKANTEQTFRDRVARQTEELRFNFPVEVPLRTNHLRLRVMLEGGAMSWKVKDPKGTVVWEGRADRTAELSHDFPSAIGNWTVDLGLENATGSYDLRWKARS